MLEDEWHRWWWPSKHPHGWWTNLQQGQSSSIDVTNVTSRSVSASSFVCLLASFLSFLSCHDNASSSFLLWLFLPPTTSFLFHLLGKLLPGTSCGSRALSSSMRIQTSFGLNTELSQYRFSSWPNVHVGHKSNFPQKVALSAWTEMSWWKKLSPADEGCNCLDPSISCCCPRVTDRFTDRPKGVRVMIQTENRSVQPSSLKLIFSLASVLCYKSGVTWPLCSDLCPHSAPSRVSCGGCSPPAAVIVAWRYDVFPDMQTGVFHVKVILQSRSSIELLLSFFCLCARFHELDTCCMYQDLICFPYIPLGQKQIWFPGRGELVFNSHQWGDFEVSDNESYLYYWRDVCVSHQSHVSEKDVWLGDAIAFVTARWLLKVEVDCFHRWQVLPQRLLNRLISTTLFFRQHKASNPSNSSNVVVGLWWSQVTSVR